MSCIQRHSRLRPPPPQAVTRENHAPMFLRLWLLFTACPRGTVPAPAWDYSLYCSPPPLLLPIAWFQCNECVGRGRERVYLRFCVITQAVKLLRGSEFIHAVVHVKGSWIGVVRLLFHKLPALAYVFPGLSSPIVYCYGRVCLHGQYSTCTTVLLERLRLDSRGSRVLVVR